MEVCSHKTVLVLDRCLYFNESSKHQVDFDVFVKLKGPPGLIPIAPITKSMWTCNVEAAFEYARIVYDIFPSDKLLYFIINDSQPSSINNWSAVTQNLQHISSGFASKAKELLPGARQRLANQSNIPDHLSLMNGLSLALKALCEPTPKQQAEISEHGKTEVENTGRIVCLSSFKNNEVVQKLEESIQEALLLQNQLVTSGDASLSISKCHLVLIDITPIGQNSRCSKVAMRNVSPLLTSELHCSKSGQEMASKLVELAIEHYNLALTTVMGIPMKEEQNALSSANYDVELLHCKDAHSELIRSGYLEGTVTKSKEIIDTNTIPLKWCTPKTTASEMQQCYGVHRVTPVDVNSRPSLCLTNFLLGGRSVMLEHHSKAGQKCMSHMLTSHAGEIFIHSLVTFRSILEDPPSISEGPGGRLTDYRIQDFGELMKTCRLAPMSCTDTGELPIEGSKKQLERITRHWPLVFSDTILFNMPSSMERLPTLLAKETLSEHEVVECLTVIYNVATMESKNEPLLAASAGVRSGKNMKREEQYKQVWAELEKLIRCHSNTSPNHARVLSCLLDCKKQENVRVGKEEKSSTDRIPKLSEKKQDVPKRDLEDLVPDVPIKKFKAMIANISKNKNLLDLWNEHMKEKCKPKKQPFFGLQMSVNNKFELYQHMKENQNNDNDSNGETLLPEQ